MWQRRLLKQSSGIIVTCASCSNPIGPRSDFHRLELPHLRKSLLIGIRQLFAIDSTTWTGERDHVNSTYKLRLPFCPVTLSKSQLCASFNSLSLHCGSGTRTRRRRPQPLACRHRHPRRPCLLQLPPRLQALPVRPPMSKARFSTTSTKFGLRTRSAPDIPR